MCDEMSGNRDYPHGLEPQTDSTHQTAQILAGNYLKDSYLEDLEVQGGGTDLCVNKPHCAAAVRP